MLPYRESRLTRTTLILFFVVLLGYATYEARGLLYGPMINVPEEAITVHDSYTLIKGRAARITELQLNGKTISVTENGEFEEPYLLAEGSNHLILDARDARGRTTRKVLDIIYEPAVAPAPHESATSTP